MRILTFDIEDWFHILDNDSTRGAEEWAAFEPRLEANVGRILDCLDRHGQSATFFCLGWVARRHPDVLRAIHARGHRIGSHSDMHQLAYEQTPQAFAADLARSIESLQAAVGEPVRLYRAPGFSVTAANIWVFEKLVEAGIEVDASVFPAARAHGGLPHWRLSGPALLDTPAGALKLFPMNVASLLGRRFVFSGGGYFRLFPGVVLQRLFARGDYVMTYFHPRDFDPGQPVLDGLPRMRRFKSYVGLAGAMGKLERLLTELDFLDLEAAEAAIDWARVPRLRLDAAGTPAPRPAGNAACA